MAAKTRAEFEAKAIRDAEKAEELPKGFWGTRSKAQGPNNVEVKELRGAWKVFQNEEEVSKHEDRVAAFRKAVKLSVV